MAAQPKKKISHVRGKTRRAHIGVKFSKLPLCPSCRHPKPGHIVCPECGYYGKKKILTTKTDKRIAKQLHDTKKAEAAKTKAAAVKQAKPTLPKAKPESKKNADSVRRSASYGGLTKVDMTETKAEAKSKNTRTTDEVKASKVKNK